jgi:DNA repair exonuclease SbcCD nuclease subunit
MISTDNHVGYLETDPIRGNDSFASFREMLQHARANQVDFVLLGGDLFHDNKPSRQTLCRTVNILRQFAFGENPITFEIISDQAKNFPTTSDAQTGCWALRRARARLGCPALLFAATHISAASVAWLSASGKL